jgi:hypothetical protein
MQADAEATLFDVKQGFTDVPYHIRMADQIADRHLPLGGVLYFIESVGARLDDESLAITYKTCQIGLFGLPPR